MGDYSRDTFKLTNVLHQVLTGETVASSRHYVGIRLQQGVPLLDSDWNELEDLRRLELQALVQMFIGTGVPTGNDGFRITSSGDPNNFSIHPGVILAGGLMIINAALTTYLAQPEQAGLAPLTTPGGVTDRNDVVYLDVWHDEVGAAGGPSADPRLMNGLVGVETAVRIRRRWQVKVAQGASDLSGTTPPSGHVYLPLALLVRRPNAAVITDAMVVERRVTGLTISSNLKSPLDLRRGAETVDCARVAQMMRDLRTALFQRLSTNKLPHASPSPQQETYLIVALQSLMNTAQAGETQALTRNVGERDALALLKDLYQAQKDWLGSLAALGNAGNAAQSFITDYQAYLDGQPGTLITGLKPPLAVADVIGAVMAQEALNAYLANPIETLPEGTVIALYRQVSPFTSMIAGVSFTFTFDITAQFTSPQPNETFTVTASLPADFGTVTPASVLLTFPAGAPTTQTVTFTVNPTGVAASGSLSVTAVATRKATLKSTQPPLLLTRGSNPPPPAFFFYAGPALNASGQLSISQAQLAGAGRDVVFRLKNTNAAASQTYQITGQVVIAAPASSAGWSPLAPLSLPPVSLAASAETPVAVHVDGPKPPANPAPATGTTGTVVASAVLVGVNGIPPGTPQTPIVVTVPFIVT